MGQGPPAFFGTRSFAAGMSSPAHTSKIHKTGAGFYFFEKFFKNFWPGHGSAQTEKRTRRQVGPFSRIIWLTRS